MRKFGGFDNGTGKRVLNKLKTIQLRFMETEVERITIIKLGVDNRGRPTMGVLKSNYFYAVRISISLATLSEIFIRIGYFF